jgi:hypothetical protein
MSSYARRRGLSWMWWSLAAALVVTMLVPVVPGAGGNASAQGPQVFQAAGNDPGAIQAAVNAFRNALGGNNNQAGAPGRDGPP